MIIQLVDGQDIVVRTTLVCVVFSGLVSVTLAGRSNISGYPLVKHTHGSKFIGDCRGSVSSFA